jgi:LCP family protein required for cell wall assembly
MSNEPGESGERDEASGISGLPVYSEEGAREGAASPASQEHLRRERSRRRTRRILMWIGAVTVVAVGGTAAFAAYEVYHIDHNIAKAPLHAAATPVPSVVTETPDAFGNLPLNILVIGTDARLAGEDAKLGGFVDPSGRADVEMLVHVSADRSNATIVSIPRDTMIPLPECVDQKGNHFAAKKAAMANSALAAGPGCQVDTIEAFTHVQIDHFIMVDFSGVVNLTNAVGGVSVCVTKAVHDPDSHLDLPAGTSQITGTQALAFLRTREGFSNGSDLYRTQAQHQYLSSLIRKLQTEATLDDPLKALHLADVASKALTVDPGIAGVTKLLDLANTMKKVPADRITFMTLPTVDYKPDPNRVAPDTALDNQIFTLIAHDESVTMPTAGASATPTPSASSSPTQLAPTPTSSSTESATVDPASVKEPVVVENGTLVNGRSKQVADTLRGDGFAKATGVGYSRSDVALTQVFYSPGHQAAAEAVAAALKLPASAVSAGGDGGAPVEVLVGNDFTNGPTYQGTGSGVSTLPTSVQSYADAENAGDPNLCVKAH